MYARQISESQGQKAEVLNNLLNLEQTIHTQALANNQTQWQMIFGSVLVAVKPPTHPPLP